MGAHIATEGAATCEFKYLLKFIKNNYKGLEYKVSLYNLDLKKLNNLTSPRSRKIDCIKALDWIKIHTKVGQDHFEKSVIAANIAIKYRPKNIPKEVVIQKIHKGISLLVRIQQKFLAGTVS